MNVLVVSSKPPYPQIDGGCIAVSSMVEGIISEDIKVHLLTLSTQKHPFDKNAFPSHWQEKIKIKNITIDTKIKFFALIFNLLSHRSYFTSRFYSKAFEKIMIETIKENTFDIIQLESVFLCSYLKTLKQNTKAKIILRSHNMEHQLALQRAKKSAFIKKWYLNLQANRLKKEELFLAKNAHGIACISLNEKNEFQTMNKHVAHIPTGISPNNFTYQPSDSFFYIGAMDWQPNIEGINWLIKNIWSKLDPNTTLHLAGKSLSPSQQYALNNIKNHGEVENAKNFMKNNGIMLVPLFSGSGLRIKILEAGALGIPIIATKKAVEGIGLANGEDYLEANSAAEFKASISKLQNDKVLQVQLSKAIKKKITTLYNTQNISRKLIEFYRNI